MKKTVTVVSTALLAMLLVGGAVAAGPSSLLNTTWTGVVTIVARSADGNVTLTPDNATLVFTGENGEFLAGTLDRTLDSTSVDFTCVRDGRSLHMTAKGYLMFGEIFMGHPVKRGARPPQNMLIQGNDLTEGNMFQGILKKQQ